MRETNGRSVSVQLKEATMLKAAIWRWRERRRERRIELRERKIIARETLRDFKQTTGDEGGLPGAPGY